MRPYLLLHRVTFLHYMTITPSCGVCCTALYYTVSWRSASGSNRGQRRRNGSSPIITVCRHKPDKELYILCLARRRLVSDVADTQSVIGHQPREKHTKSTSRKKTHPSGDKDVITTMADRHVVSRPIHRISTHTCLVRFSSTWLDSSSVRRLLFPSPDP